MPQRVLFAAGGTMGHIAPALAVAEELQREDQSILVSLVGSAKGIESRIESKYHWDFIPKVPLPRGISVSALSFPFRLSYAILKSIPLVGRSNLVLGFGGYISTPIYFAAKLLRKPIMIHEANALPGFANRLGRRWAREVFVNFATLGRSWNAQVVGIPLRDEIVDLAHRSGRDAAPSLSKRERSRPKILVMGGSLGSAKINEVIWNSLEQLLQKYEIRHLVGYGKLPEKYRAHLEQGARNRRVDSYRVEEFSSNMASAYEEADLVIARAGAVTCAEIRELRKRAILVPLGHGNGEQNFNAEEIVNLGLGISVSDQDFTSSWLLGHIDQAVAIDLESLNNPLQQPLLRAATIMAAAIKKELARSSHSKAEHQ